MVYVGIRPSSSARPPLSLRPPPSSSGLPTDQQPKKPPIKLKITRRPPAVTNNNDPTVSSSKKSQDEEEADPAIEEHFLLRLPKGEWCEKFRSLVRERKVPEDVGITFKDDRGALFSFDGENHAAKLVDLPTLIESHKTLDNKQLYKVADVCQMLVVDGKRLPDDYTIPAICGNQIMFPDGITPPLRNVRKRRFRKRVSKKTIEVVEHEVERLLQEDALAEDVQYEVHEINDTAHSDSEMGTPAPASMDFDEEEFYNGSTFAEEDEGEDDDIDLAEDLAAEIERELQERRDDEESNEDDDDDEEEEEDGGEDKADEGEDEESEVDSEEETEDGASSLQLRKSVLLDEITELEISIQRKTADLLNATNAIIKKRFGDVVEKMKLDLSTKKAELDDVQRKLGG